MKRKAPRKVIDYAPTRKHIKSIENNNTKECGRKRAKALSQYSRAILRQGREKHEHALMRQYNHLTGTLRRLENV